MTRTINNVLGNIPKVLPAMEHKKLIENLAVAVFLVDEALTLKYLNPAAEEIIGTGIRHALNKSLTDFIQDHTDGFIGHIRQCIATGHPITVREICVKRIGRSDMTIDCAMTPLQSTKETDVCILEITQIDRLVRITREEHLLFEGQATRNMLRGLAHEIKNPLGGLRGAAQLLAGELPDKSMHDYTDVIIREADRLKKLVDRMLGPNFAPAKREVNIHDVLEHIRHLAIAETPTGINFNTDYDPSIPDLHADHDLLVQAILNIARNAVRALNKNGNVTLQTKVLRHFTIGEACHRLVVQICVKDDGPGIPEELQPQIFFPMVSGDEEGIGLGLSISQNIINAHSGLIEFDSVPGNTEFRILLPLNSAEISNKKEQYIS